MCHHPRLDSVLKLFLFVTFLQAAALALAGMAAPSSG